MRKIKLILIGHCFALLCISGCSPKVSDVDLPEDFPQAFSLSGTNEVPEKWWLHFNDDSLNILIDTALQNNLPLRVFWYQMKEAGEFVDITSSEKWPEIFLQLQSGLNIPEPDFVGGENTQLSLRANYELDLFGRIRHSIQAEKYRFQASFYDYRTASVTLTAEIALTWFRLKAIKSQIQLIGQQLESNKQVLALIRARFASGQVRGVDILRQEQLIANTREQKIDLESQFSTFNHQLHVLLGRPPDDRIVVSSQLPELPPLPETGVPLELVNRRPDIQSSFYRLQASDRELAAAVSNKYPRLNFSITTAVRSNTLEGLLQSQAMSLAGSLLAPLFYGGRLNAEVDRAEAVRQQMLNEYSQTVVEAFQEVEDALVMEVKMTEQIEVIEEQVLLSERTFGQLRSEYLNGSIPYLDVLITLDQQQQLRRELIEARLSLLEIRIALYRALAGGFETPRETAEES